MYKIEPKNKKALIQAALGILEADLVIENAKLVNVFTGEIYPVHVYVYDGFISHVETDLQATHFPVKQRIDAKGQYLIPGLIDAHVHIESSMLTPRNFARGVVVHGTTTAVTDPHEMANVFGVEAVRYMHDAAEGLPMRQLINIPSCVPAVPGKENSGADFTKHEIASLLDLKRVIGLAEVMDFLAVIHGEDRMLDIIDTAKKAGLYIQGHAPFLSGRALSAYVIGGPTTCHESRLGWEFQVKMRAGMYVDARESSIAKNIKTAIEATKDFRFFDHFCICTDDKEPDDILHEGHMNEVLRQAVKHGLDPLIAIKSATLNNAREMRLENLGAIAPGYVADLLLVPDLIDFKPSLVVFEGKVVAKDGVLVEPIADVAFEIEQRNSVNVVHLSLDQFIFKAPIQDGKVDVTVMTYEDYGLSSTHAVVEKIPVKNGILDLSFDPDLKYVVVLNRYGKETVGYGVVRHFGTSEGAIASTVSHDSHNLTIVYDTPENGFLAAKRLLEVGGGMCVVKQQQVLQTLVLQVGGLMSIKPAQEVANEASEMKKAMQEVGLTQMQNPLLRIVTLALPVIPHCKMSDLGIIDVNTKEILPLYPQQSL